MAQGTQEDASDSLYSTSTLGEQKVDFDDSDRRSQGSKYARTRDNKRRTYSSTDGTSSQNRNKLRSNSRNNNNSNNTNNTHNCHNSGSSHNSESGRHAVAHQRARAVLVLCVFSAALSLGNFIAALGISDSPLGIWASILECVAGVGIFAVGVFGVLKQDPAFLAFYTLFSISMALAQTFWLVLGSYSIYQLNASMRVTKDEEQLASMKGVLRSMQLYVASAALSVVGYSFAAFLSRRLKNVYEGDSGKSARRDPGKRSESSTSEEERTHGRHATVSVASPFA